MNTFETNRARAVEVVGVDQTKNFYVVLECDSFESAVDAIEQVERAFNGQLSPATYEPIGGHSNSQNKAFILKISDHRDHDVGPELSRIRQGAGS